MRSVRSTRQHREHVMHMPMHMAARVWLQCECARIARAYAKGRASRTPVFLVGRQTTRSPMQFHSMVDLQGPVTRASSRAVCGATDSANGRVRATHGPHAAESGQ